MPASPALRLHSPAVSPDPITEIRDEITRSINFADVLFRSLCSPEFDSLNVDGELELIEILIKHFKKLDAMLARL